MASEYNITAVNSLGPWKFARAGEKFGAAVMVTGIRRKDTDEAVPEKKEARK